MRYMRFVTWCADQTWMIKLEKYLVSRQFILSKAGILDSGAGGEDSRDRELSEAKVEAALAARTQRRSAEDKRTIAILPIYGIISQRINLMDDLSGPGSTSTERLGKLFRAAMEDSNVSSIVLEVASPGGTVYGVDELSAEIYKARGQKPIIAVVNSLAASAAYYIASAADEIHITPSGEAGSIGVFAEHVDISRALDAMGVKPTLIFAGDYKVEGNPYEPLSKEGLEHIQSRVDEYYGGFLEAVARNRGVTRKKVKDDFGRGRVFGAKQAVASGLADKVETFDQVLKRLGGVPETRWSSAMVIPAPAAEALVIGSAPGSDAFCGPIRPHKTATSDESWDGPANEKRLPSPMSVETARNSYAWMDEDKIEND